MTGLALAAIILTAALLILALCWRARPQAPDETDQAGDADDAFVADVLRTLHGRR